MGKKLTLILGGARSGKSSLALKIANSISDQVLFVATATADDEEMRQRIAKHKHERPQQWRTIEAGVNVGSAIAISSFKADVVLVDCLALLASNTILTLGQQVQEDEANTAMQAEIDDLLRVYENNSAEWIIVSNEVGLGIVPAYPMGRVYRDCLGRANQGLASVADEVFFLVSGIPLKVK